MSFANFAAHLNNVFVDDDGLIFFVVIQTFTIIFLPFHYNSGGYIKDYEDEETDLQRTAPNGTGRNLEKYVLAAEENDQGTDRVAD